VVTVVIILCRHFDFPTLYAWSIVAIWIAKDAILYPFVWRAYESPPRDQMVGLRGIAQEKIDPSGYIFIRGELWHAELAHGFAAADKGQAVEVLAVRGLTLSVRPVLRKHAARP
jgi:membrane protein implicated in regulation of membrane protease activity